MGRTKSVPQCAILSAADCSVVTDWGQRVVEQQKKQKLTAYLLAVRDDIDDSLETGTVAGLAALLNTPSGVQQLEEALRAVSGEKQESSGEEASSVGEKNDDGGEQNDVGGEKEGEEMDGEEVEAILAHLHKKTQARFKKLSPDEYVKRLKRNQARLIKEGKLPAKNGSGEEKASKKRKSEGAAASNGHSTKKRKTGESSSIRSNVTSPPAQARRSTRARTPIQRLKDAQPLKRATADATVRSPTPESQEEDRPEEKESVEDQCKKMVPEEQRIKEAIITLTYDENPSDQHDFIKGLKKPLPHPKLTTTEDAQVLQSYDNEVDRLLQARNLLECALPDRIMNGKQWVYEHFGATVEVDKRLAEGGRNTVLARGIWKLMDGDNSIINILDEYPRDCHGAPMGWTSRISKHWEKKGYDEEDDEPVLNVGNEALRVAYRLGLMSDDDDEEMTDRDEDADEDGMDGAADGSDED